MVNIFHFPLIFRCFWLYKHPLFDYFILRIIILSSLKLVVDTYISPDTNPTLTENLSTVDMVVSSIFLLEFAIKVVTLGFFWDIKSYLRDSWCKLDFVIVLFSLFDFNIIDSELGFIKVVRLLRILRPLRFISHNKNMRLIVNSLLHSIGGIFNVVIVILLIW
jgi:hypothetical protein